MKFFKLYDKVKMLLTKKSGFLIFGFSFWFQFIQRIDHLLPNCVVNIWLKEYSFTSALFFMQGIGVPIFKICLHFPPNRDHPLLGAVHKLC